METELLGIYRLGSIWPEILLGRNGIAISSSTCRLRWRMDRSFLKVGEKRNFLVLEIKRSLCLIGVVVGIVFGVVGCGS